MPFAKDLLWLLQIIDRNIQIVGLRTIEYLEKDCLCQALWAPHSFLADFRLISNLGSIRLGDSIFIPPPLTALDCSLYLPMVFYWCSDISHAFRLYKVVTFNLIIFFKMNSGFKESGSFMTDLMYNNIHKKLDKSDQLLVFV